MREAEGFTKFGKFLIEPDRFVDGELHVAGEETLLYLCDDDFFLASELGSCVTGTLHDLTKVTLMHCVASQMFGHSARMTGEGYYHAKLFPHFVLEGDQHLGVDERVIVMISLVLKDAAALFYDFDAFGFVIDAQPHIERVASANKLGQPIPLGPNPAIAYFAGKCNILEVDTILGKVEAQHHPSLEQSGSCGVRIDNEISINIVTESSIAFDETIDRTLRLLRFFELIIGRPQSLTEFIIHIGTEDNPVPLKVHWSHHPSRVEDSSNDKQAPSPGDLLLDPIGRPDEFGQVMSSWLEKDKERQDARGRFSASFASQQKYSLGRLVGAANMFDILPATAAPKDAVLSDELRDAKKKSETIFKGLPASYERDSALNAFGRLGKASLKHKTRHRAQLVVGAVGDRFSDIIPVLNEAVNCRNHYVHGSPSKIDYSQNFEIVAFFTDTLEFIFAASELIEAGWDIGNFINTSTTMTHPFGAYKVNYDTNLQTLKTLIPNFNKKET